MKRPTEAECRLIGEAAFERLGPEGAKLFEAVMNLAAERHWSMRETAEHAQGVAEVLRALVAGWVEEDGTSNLERPTPKGEGE